MLSLWQDLHYGVRMLLKKPGFTLAAALTLGLGVGANTAIFSVLNSVLLRKLPYSEPERLLTTRFNQSAPDLEDMLAWSRSFETIGGLVFQPLDYQGSDEPSQIRAGHVTGGYFKTLGVAPAAGRVIREEDDKPGGEFVAVISHALSKRLFGDQSGALADVLGKTLNLSGNSYTIIGVMPPEFKSPRDETEVWVPVHVSNGLAAAYRGVHFLNTYLRLKPGVTEATAQEDLRQIDKRLAELYPEENKNRRTVLIGLHDRVVGDSRTTIWLLFGAVGLLLLIACGNYANLLLTRGASRRQEMAIRVALGAPRRRLIRQLLTESVLLSLLGGSVGLLLALWGVETLVSLKPANLPRLETIGVDVPVLAFAMVLSTLTGILFGLAPALAATSNDVSDALKEGGRGATGAANPRLRSALATIEIAMALILLIGAGLLIKSFLRLRAADPGFTPDHVLSMRLELPETRYKSIPEQIRYRRAILDEVNTVPNVQAALISEPPLSGESLNHDFTVEGWSLAPGDEPNVETRSIQGDYFSVMQIPLVAGRKLSPQDNESSPLVGVANQALVKQYFPQGDAIGRRVRWARDEQATWITIVGVAGDVKHFGLDLPDLPALYTPYSQSGRAWKRWQSLVVRSSEISPSLSDSLRKTVWRVDPLIPITKLRPMTELVSLSYEQRRFQTLLLAVFAAVALLLSMIGVYGVVSYAVAQRTNEIGVRMALGARESDILRMVLAQGLKMALIGAAIGLLVAFPATQVLKSTLYGVSATDPATFTIFPLLTALVALAACWIPARRAMRIDPMLALRIEN
jgi:predicted permease